MQRIAFLLLVGGLAGCPPPTRFIVADVQAAGAPLNDAIVALHCDHGPKNTGAADAAMRTDDTGRARLPVASRDMDAERCTVTVGKPGFRTVETGGLHLCTEVTSCPPVLVQLVVLGVIAPDGTPVPPPAEPDRTYTEPPAEVTP
jgi:hypothetical protein